MGNVCTAVDSEEIIEPSQEDGIIEFATTVAISEPKVSRIRVRVRVRVR